MSFPAKQPSNSRPFQPGDTRINRHGRPPKVKCIADILRRIGREKLSPEVRASLRDGDTLPTSATFIEAVCRNTMLAALRGESWAVEFIAERTEGRVTQSVNLTARTGRNYEDMTDDELQAEIELQHRVTNVQEGFKQLGRMELQQEIERTAGNNALPAPAAEIPKEKET